MQGFIALIAIFASLFAAYYLLRFLILGGRYFERELGRDEKTGSATNKGGKR